MDTNTGPCYTTLFFDLDDTLYASDSGLWAEIRTRMTDYMVERLHVPPAEAPALRKRYYETYGTTLRGLQHHHHLDVDEFLTYVHDVPLERFLKPSLELRNLLLSLPQRRWIFTNANEWHARRVISTLGLEDCFDGIVDIVALDFYCKPSPEAYRFAMQAAGETQPLRCIFFDDSPKNLAPARALGFTTVLVGAGQPQAAVDFTIPDLLSLPQILPQLWDSSGSSKLP